MMNRFFLIPLLALLILATGCTCSVRGSASMPTASPITTRSPAPLVTAAPTMNATSEPTVAPVVPTEPIASPSASAAAGN